MVPAAVVLYGVREVVVLAIINFLLVNPGNNDFSSHRSCPVTYSVMMTIDDDDDDNYHLIIKWLLSATVPQ